MAPFPPFAGAFALDAARPGRSLFGLLHPYRKRVIALSLVFIVKDSPTWLLPVITAGAVDLVVAGGPLASIGWLSLGAAALVLQVYPTHLLFTRVYMSAVRSVAVSLRNAITARLQIISIGYLGRTSASVMQSKVVRDVENIELMFGQIGNPLGSATIVFCGATVITAFAVPQFLPVYALTIPAGIGVWWIMRGRTHRSNEDFRLQMEDFSREVGAMATLMPITRAHGLEAVAYQKVSRRAETIGVRGLGVDLVNGRFGALSWVALQLLATGCLLGSAAFAVTGVLPITPGDVVLLGTYFATLTGAVLTVLNVMPVVAKGRESLRSIAEVLNESDIEQNEGKTRVASVVGAYRIEDLTVQFSGSPEAALLGVSLNVSAGETVAFVGSSGSGKSTLVNAILGFVRPSSGRVLLDGQDINEIDLRSVRQFVSVVPQESVLFQGTVRENVTYGLSNVDERELYEALVQANAMDFIQALPEGWDTLVGERGTRLSGGQRQRIAVARALIRDPRILILDEATSALDSESEHAVQQALDRLMEGRTTFVIAHRLSTVRRADKIVVLERGTVIEMGTHEELIAREGRYSALWGLQHG